MFARLAPQLADDGWRPIPVRPGTKLPAASAWSDRAPPSVLARWATRYPDHSIGLVCGAVVAVDIDVLEPAAAQQLADLATGLLGGTPLIRVGRAPKRILIYRLTSPMPTRRVALSVGRIETLAEGAFFVSHGTHPETGRPFAWVGESDPEFTPISALQEVTPLQIENLLDQALRLFPIVQISDGATTTSKTHRAGLADVSAIVRCPRTGTVLDGRDTHLARLVYAAWRSDKQAGWMAVALAAWREFVATTDLTRPARSGRRAWCLQDSITKTRALFRKGQRGAVKRIAKARGRLAVSTHPELSQSEREAFLTHTLGLHEAGEISRTEWRLSDLMLGRLRNGACVDAAAFLATELKIDVRTLRRARRSLLIKGLWRTARQLGNRESTAPYFPTTEIASKALMEQVLLRGGVTQMSSITRGVQGGEGGASTSSSPLGSAIPAQPPDAVQTTLLPPAIPPAELLEALANWPSGKMPRAVRAAYVERKRALGLRESDIAKLVQISREHIANARFETFGLSEGAAARIKNFLLPSEFPLPPDQPADDKPARQHHRRGGKRASDPGPMPALRLFAKIQGGAAEESDTTVARGRGGAPIGGGLREGNAMRATVAR